MDHEKAVRQELRVVSHNLGGQSDDGGRVTATWALPLALAGVLVAGEPASADSEIYGYVGPNGVFEMTNVPTDQRFRSAESQVRRLSHRASAEEVEEAVKRYAFQFQLHPALLLAVIKAESDFNPTVISRSGAVGLKQLIPETAIRHGVLNLYGTCGTYWIDLTGTCGWRSLRIMQVNGAWSGIAQFRPIRKLATMSGR